MPSAGLPVLLHGSSCFQCSADIIIEEETRATEYATGLFLTNEGKNDSCLAVTYSTDFTDTERSPVSSEAAGGHVADDE